ncbi:MAG: carbon-nitrogen hydrolase family protein [Planctomycetota bacterium]
MAAIHIAVAQIHSRSGQIEANLARMLPQIRSAAAVGADAILFSETCVHSFALVPVDIAAAEPANGAVCGRLTEWARKHGIVILAGFLERDGRAIYNSHVAAFPDGRRVVQRKHAVTPIELQAGLSGGPPERTVLAIGGVRCALIICADSGSTEIADDCRRQGVALRLAPTAGGGTRAEMLTESELDSEDGRARYAEDRKKVFRAEAVHPPEPQWPTAFASANALGYDGATDRGWHRGHCMIVDRHGIVRAQIPGTCVIEHQHDQMVHARLVFPGSVPGRVD